MNTQDYLNIISLIIGIAGLLYAKYQSHERTKLQNAICAQAWSLYSQANNATGNIQLAFQKYKETYLDKFDSTVLELLSKADAFGQDVFKGTINFIHFSEPKYDASTIHQWVTEGRITDVHKGYFKLLMPTNKSNVINK